MLPTLIGFAFAFSLIFFRVPIAIALALTGFFGITALNGVAPAYTMVAMVAKDTAMSYLLIVLPMFIFMGNILAGSGISDDLYRAAQAIVGRRRGGLAMATIVSCGIFGAVCGSSVATAATMGKVAMPAMRKFGYSDGLSAASVAAGGTLGILIPPSVIMVVYGVATETHIGKLFAAGFIPGFLGIMLYIAAIKWSVWRNPAAAPPVSARLSMAEIMQTIIGVGPVLLIMGVTLGGIYIGIFSATEASAIGAMTSLIYAVVFRSLRWAKLYEIIKDTVHTSGMMFAVLIGATVFGEFINLTNVHSYIVTLVDQSWMSPMAVIFIMVVIYIVLGCVLESISMILLTLPVFFPIVVALGFDPVWFGIIVVVVTEIGLITPPIGVNLFVIRALDSSISMRTIINGILPFIGADFVRVTLLVLFPIISLWLPKLLFG